MIEWKVCYRKSRAVTISFLTLYLLLRAKNNSWRGVSSRIASRALSCRPTSRKVIAFSSQTSRSNLVVTSPYGDRSFFITHLSGRDAFAREMSTPPQSTATAPIHCRFHFLITKPPSSATLPASFVFVRVISSPEPFRFYANDLRLKRHFIHATWECRRNELKTINYMLW